MNKLATNKLANHQIIPLIDTVLSNSLAFLLLLIHECPLPQINYKTHIQFCKHSNLGPVTFGHCVHTCKYKSYAILMGVLQHTHT